MVQAKIRLKDGGPRSYATLGHKFVQGSSINSTNPSEIAQFASDGHLVVEMIEGKLPPSPGAESEPPPPPSGDEDDGGGDDETPGQPVVYAEGDLNDQNKAELVKIGAEQFGLTLDMSMKKPELVAAILEAQSKKE